MAITKLLTSNFKTQMARLFVRSFKRSTISTDLYLDVDRYVNLGYVDPYNYAVQITNNDPSTAITVPDTSHYYVFAGNSTIGTQTLAGNPCIDTSVYGSQYNIYDNMLFGKRVTDQDVSLMIARNEWTIDTVYDMYDDKDVLLHQKKFFVSVKEGGQWHIFKCIDNNNRAPSEYTPSPSGANNTNASTILASTSSVTADDFYQTPDGYVWMFMYSIPTIIYEKFATLDFIPLSTTFTQLPPFVGSIETMRVESKGGDYLYAEGIIKTINLNPTNTKFYITPTTTSVFEVTNVYKDYGLYCPALGEVRKIIASGIDPNGDRFIEIKSPFAKAINTNIDFKLSPFVEIVDMNGTNAVAVPEMTAGVINRIIMINTGKDYTNPTVTITGKPGYYQSGTWVQTNTVATVIAIVSPPKGHGRDLVNELFADKACVSVDFIKDDHPVESYKQYGLMLNPVFKEVTLTFYNSAIVSSNTVVGDVLVQELTGAYGLIKSITNTGTTTDFVLSNVIGVFEYDFDVVAYNSKDAFMPIKPTTTTINTLQEKFVISEIVDNSGEILLIRDDAAVVRSNIQTERVKLLVDF